MGVYRRKDSKFWWLWLETAPAGQQRVATDILIGETVTQRRDSRALAVQVYHQRMNDIGARRHQLPTAQPAIRFAKYAEPYKTDVIAHRAGRQREEEMLAHLVAFFGDDLLSAIDPERVRTYHTARKTAKPAASARTINREVDLLKGMLRDAVPKYLATSPIKGMARLRIVPPRRRYTSATTFAKLLAVCEDAQDTAMLVFARDGLARLSDLLDLKHTDRDGPVYWIGDPKNGDPYEMALSMRAVAAADALADNGSPYLFPKFRRAEQERDWAGSVRQRLKYLCRQADVPYGIKQHEGVTFHWGTRRSGATDYLMKHKRALKGVQAQGGWKKPDVLIDIYTEVSRDDLLTVVGQKPKRQRRRA